LHIAVEILINGDRLCFVQQAKRKHLQRFRQSLNGLGNIDRRNWNQQHLCAFVVFLLQQQLELIAHDIA
jgi:hypothetical protein